MSDNGAAYVLRLGSGEVEAKLFARRWLYVGVRRPWQSGSKVFFARKSEVFTGFGVVARILLLEELDPAERELCLARNWSAKIYFETLARFHPPVPLEATPAASQNPLTLHGSEISPEVASAIESSAACRIFV